MAKQSVPYSDGTANIELDQTLHTQAERQHCSQGTLEQQQELLAQNFSRSHAKGQTDSNVLLLGRRMSKVSGAWFGKSGPN